MSELPSQAFNVRVMDVDAFIAHENAARVSSLAIIEASTQNLHAEGFFSEEIFGQIGTAERLSTFGYVELNTTILSPVIYKATVKLAGLYEEIMSGKTYAVFDPVLKNFQRITEDPEDVEGADTGFSFFMRHYNEIDFPATSSTSRENRIELIAKYHDIALYKRIPVLPAGLRDVKVEDGKTTQDDVNKLYTTLLSMTKGIPPGATSPVYDSLRYSIQKKVVEIYDYYLTFMSGKRGFLQGAYGSRRIALGTRNVITAASYDMASPDDPQALKPNETKAGLYQLMKGSMPLITHYMKTVFMDPILGSSDVTKVALTHPETYELVYSDIPLNELNRFNNTEAIESWVNRFSNVDVRELPIQLKTASGEKRYLCMVYDSGVAVALFRSINDLKRRLGDDIDMSRIRPLTWVEAFYLVAYTALHNKHCFITRYPVIEAGSCYPSRIHITTTAPARVVTFYDLLSEELSTVYPQYPILGKGVYADSIVVRGDALAGLGADELVYKHSITALY